MRSPDKELLITHLFDAPITAVFEAWTDPEKLKHWYAPDGCTIAYKSIEVKPGGRFHQDMRIQGGADTIQQFLNAELVDGFFIHIAPVFLGSGIRLFDGIDKDEYDMQIVEVIPSEFTTHLRYKLTKR